MIGPAWIDRIGDAKDIESLVPIHVRRVQTMLKMA